MNVKRIFALLIALSLALTAMGGMYVTVSAAAAYEQTDVYVLNYSNQNIEGYENYDAKRLYASDHYAGLYVDEDGDGVNEANWNWTCFSVLNMINTTKLAEKGEGAYASIPVYCADAITDGVAGYEYRRINMEDSDYFTDEVAGRLRAVFMNSFPYVTNMSTVADSVNAWITNSGGAYAQVVNLTESEAISATQAAIWTLTNHVEVYAPYLGTGGYYNESEMVDTMIFGQQATDYTEGNINALYHYLMNLDPMGPLSTVVSDAAFGETAVNCTPADDGTYTAKLTTTVTATVDEGDRLTLTAVSGDLVSDTVAVSNGTNTYTLTITGLTENTGDITVNLDGQQDASDVFLFDPLNGRDASQSMIGYDDSSLPVHAEVTVSSSDRVLNLYKTTANGTPLENISFEIYKVCALEEYVNGNVVIGTGVTTDDQGNQIYSKPTDADLEKYQIPANLIATVTTDADGVASYNFGAVDGVYLVRELKNAVIESTVDPFFVAIPGGDSDNPVYAVNVYPKNTVIEEDVDIEKDVIEIDQQEETLDVNKVHTWIIQATIPSGLADAQKYVISDTLDYRLTYMGSVVVTVSEKTAKAGDDLLTLEPGTDYTLSTNKESVTVGGKTYETDRFVVSLTAAGRKVVAAVQGTEPEVRIYFDAVINSNAELAEEIPNQAHIDYTNSVGTDYEDDSDIPYVYTGGLKIHKTDASDVTKMLEGAVFKLARAATAEEIEAGLSEKLTVDGQQMDVVYAAFYNNADLTGDKVSEVTTNSSGIALFYGLAYGDYYLVETAAPEGYNKLTDPVSVTINAISHLDDDTATVDIQEGASVTVKNSAKFTLPTTGGVGTTAFTAAGVIIISAAMLLIFVPGRKKRA